MYRLCVGLRCAEMRLIDRMGSASLRSAASHLLSESLDEADEKKFKNSIFSRALDIRSDLKYWDLVVLLQLGDSPKELWDVVLGKLSKLSPKHLIDLYLVGPEEVLPDIEYRLVELANSTMYIDEFVAIVRVLARKEMTVPNSKFLNGLCVALVSNESLHTQMGYLHACEIIGGLKRLNFLPKKIHEICLQKCKSELKLMTLEDHWKTQTGFSKLMFSSEDLETMCREELGKKPKNFDQVSRPMEFFQFCRFNGWLTESLLLSACTWANNAVYRPATRTQAHRRPTIFEVALLADLCKEFDISSDRIEKAIRVTVESRGGTRTSLAKPKPTKYRRRRAYLRDEDGYAMNGTTPLKLARNGHQFEKKLNEAAFAPKLRAEATLKGKHVPLWKARSNGWYFRK